ncbi:MAG: efflux RND transporter periplasmic adaptor subunit [Verrucomicrobiota bacterium]
MKLTSSNVPQLSGQSADFSIEAVSDQLAKKESRQALNAVDLCLMLNDEDRFLKAAMLLCNEINARFRCVQVGLGIFRGGHAKLAALSNTQRFDRKSELVRRMQYAMEEAADQDEETIYPRPREDSFIYRELEKYVTVAGMEAGATLPLRHNGEIFGVILLERRDERFTPDELFALRLIVDVNARLVYDLERRDQWIGRRWARGARKTAAWVFGFEHTWTKIGILCGIGVIAFLIFYQWFYRVEADFSLKAQTVLNIPAPFDGFIEGVAVDLGDTVSPNAPLLHLDRQQLLLEEAEIESRISRYVAEAEAAHSQGQFSEAQIARMQVREEEAELAIIQHRLSKADLIAPFEGFVMEGDLRERIGAPVNRGEPLYKLARIDSMSVRIEIKEEDIHEVSVGSTGELAFASRPEEKFAFVIESIEPAAQTRQEGSIFVARASFEGEPVEWWRPGMRGVAKIDVGDRSLIWVLTHRLVDFVRMKLWI